MYVLDTYILVAAMWSREGASYQLLRRALQGRLPIAVSVALALEYEAVLTRSVIRDASWASSDEIDRLLDAVFDSAVWAAPIRTRLRPSTRDPDDDMVLECAVQVGAKAIVTMNQRDFQPANELYRVALMKPGTLLAQLLSENDNE